MKYCQAFCIALNFEVALYFCDYEKQWLSWEPGSLLGPTAFSKPPYSAALLILSKNTLSSTTYQLEIIIDWTVYF